MRQEEHLETENRRFARRLWGSQLDSVKLKVLETISAPHKLRIATGDLILLNGNWYVTHTGLLAVARRSRCSGIRVQQVATCSNPAAGRWTFKATVYKSATCKGFVGYGDADPSNVSPLVRGAEMRVAETRAVNRALRKAYGIGICSIEELGSPSAQRDGVGNARKVLPRPANGNGSGNGKEQPRLRDRLCLLIRQHHLDPVLVKRFATDFCRVPDLRQASREQVEAFITQIGEMATKDPDGLVSRLDRYADKQESGGAA